MTPIVWDALTCGPNLHGRLTAKPLERMRDEWH